ncbi:outer membrane protein transport protein [Acinetobacter bouvetii]|nr:outer membrane protein transport protein [Acinetobacter bouvetii]
MPVQLYAAALETSNQSIASFLEPNDYAEVSTAIINAHIAGKTYRPDANNPSEFSEVSTPNFVKRFALSNVALKLQVQPEWSLGLIYDQPYTTDISYAFKPVLSSSAQLVNAVNFKTDSDNLTALLGYQPNLSWNYYGGVSYQNLDTQLQISGQSMGLLMDYSANAENDSAMGWLAGISYQIPAYALKTSLTYRSKIRHHPLLQEQIFSTPTILALNLSAARHINIETPQSVNFDFQSGINPNNLIYTSLRWVNWEKFKIISPLLSTTEPVSLVDYKKISSPAHWV